jgi:CheY-like chemotaxis protein
MAVILVVEDDALVRRSVESLIAAMGHHTLSASNLAGALLYLSGIEDIDALFVDVRLDARAPTGCDVADRAILLRPGLPIIYTSGAPLPIGMRAILAGGSRFLEKPYSYADLENTLGELLH